MTTILTLVWVIAMVLYSFSSDYAQRFPDHTYRALPLIRWGSLLLAMILSGYLAMVYQADMQGIGIWVFAAAVFVIITLSKVVFNWVIKRRL